MPRALLTPPSLAPGAHVALVAPAGPLRDVGDVERAVANARELGWEPVVGPHALRREGYLAGRDDERLADLQGAIDDARIDAVWCLRGGYGAMRLLDRLDLAPLARRPKALIGFSDVTALHAAMGRVGVASYHGPTARGALSAFSRASLERALVAQVDSCGVAPDARPLRGGVAGGRLVGGNLALLAALAGTPYAPDCDGAVLVLEDVNETSYRVDRMLTQLRLTGMLDRCAALVLGSFTESPDAEEARVFDLLFAELADRLRVPCLSGIPMGHIDDQWTIPLGMMAEVDVEARRLTVRP